MRLSIQSLNVSVASSPLISTQPVEQTTVLQRQEDGSVTIVSLGTTASIILSRQPDGTVVIGEQL